MTFESQDIERKQYSILKVLYDTKEPIGSITITRKLKDLGVDLGERAVRYHLKLLDERGLTSLAGRRDGRLITEQGLQELKHGLVKDKVGFVISRIELLAFRTTFDPDKKTGLVPVNISILNSKDLQKSLRLMKPVLASGFCVSNLIKVTEPGNKIGDLTIPPHKVALSTVCSIVINGTLLKAGVPLNSKFGGLLQIGNHVPVRFVELIHYSGCSLDPSAIFIKSRMTSVAEATKSGNGIVLANFRETSSICGTVCHDVISKLSTAGINGVLMIGNVSEPVCEVTVNLNHIGIVLLGGLNPLAAVEEAGIEIETHAMSTLVDYSQLIDFNQLIG
ncbi:MAG: DUF128 domain-containing protein [Dehalococcoidia bacterium]|nr:DUF128 domain-containing protein [Dehalococcoidia bacterium]